MQIKIPDDPILDSVRLRSAFGELADPKGKIARLLEVGDLISLRRGLYTSRRDMDPHGLAGTIYGPSYLSFETALAWHGMIPEKVTEILSATAKRAAAFENGFGLFRYLTIPKAVYPVGIHLIAETGLPFLIASPTKALADRIAREPSFRSLTAVQRWIEGMRVDLGGGLDQTELAECAEKYQRPSVRWLLRYAQKHQLL